MGRARGQSRSTGIATRRDAVLEALLAHVDSVFTEDRAAWHGVVRARLPRVVDVWSLVLDEVLTGGYNSLVLGCRADGQPAVLKLVLDSKAGAAEASALRHWGAGAAAEVFAFSDEQGALLLERLTPGTPADGRIGMSTDAAKLLGRLHAARPAPEGTGTLVDQYANVAERLTGMWALAPDVISREQVELAAAEFKDLSAASVPGGPALLHGDPVPANFLLGPHGYRAIDPRAVVGDPAFDAAFWALFAEQGSGITGKAVRLAEALEIDLDRVLGWARAIATDRTLQIARSPLHRHLLTQLTAFLSTQG